MSDTYTRNGCEQTEVALERGGLRSRQEMQAKPLVRLDLQRASEMNTVNNAFSLFATSVNRFVSSPPATGAAFILVVVWAAFGPATHYSENWQLIINTGTTIVTFLMVFVLNNAQSRDTTAINAKLDALILAIERADNRLVGLETLPASEAEAITSEMAGARDHSQWSDSGSAAGQQVDHDQHDRNYQQ